MAEPTGTDQAAAGRGERGRSAGRRTEEGERAGHAPPAAGGTSAAAADESERSGGKGKLTPPAAEGTSAVAVSKPEQVGRPARPALPAAGETSAPAAGAARQPNGVSGSRSGYRIPRLISPIREGYFENFQALPGVLNDCIIRAPKTIQDKFFFSVLMEAGLVLSSRAARDYGGAHFRFQRKPEGQSHSG